MRKRKNWLIFLLVSLAIIPFLTGFYLFETDKIGIILNDKNINLGYLDGVSRGDFFIVYQPQGNYKHFINIIRITKVYRNYSDYKASLPLGTPKAKNIAEKIKLKFNYFKGYRYYLDQAEKNINDGHFNKAFFNLYASITIKRKNPAAYADMAYLFFRANDLDNAKKILDIAYNFKVIPPDYEAFIHNMYAVYYFERKELGKAQVHLEKTMKLGERCHIDDLSNSYLIMGAVFYEAGNNLSAKTFYQAGITKNPNWLAALENFISPHFRMAKIIGKSFRELRILESI